MTIAGSLLFATQDLPEGPGKAIVAERCSGCHGIATVVGQRKNREEWTSVVATMIEKGARLDTADRQAAIDYLVAHFGPPPQPLPEAEVEAARTAKRYVNGICSSCHEPDVIAATQETKEGWLEIVKKMNAKGAGLSEADVDLLAGYLARTYPPE
jgi:mono/diheme cytochrome c family protein